ncbi:MAG: aminotransferase class V-fold PLP-dependent enzyme [Planctomycetota bacterium]|nr:aminotransferase class V-fold PLP-dependent enzyme [Planctomycetota bacterium]
MNTATTAQPAAAPAIEDIRARFPTLRPLGEADALLDNAGGSQVPRCVADAIRDYMLTNYVQLGADYETSRRSTAVVDAAHEFIKRLMNADGAGEVILGPSSTALCHILAEAYARAPRNGRDEIIVADTGHEANIGPWIRLADRGFTVRHWKVDPQSQMCTIDNLKSALSSRTRIVAFPHVSNLLGRIEDIGAITQLAHDAGARVVADGVAYAPHRAVDVKAWSVDWYVYSTYKVYGPHMAALYGSNDAFAELEGPNHFFIPKDDIPYKFELGGASHEGCAGLLALQPYLRFLAGQSESGDADRRTIERAFKVMTALELPLQTRLLEFLNSRDDIRLIGPAATDASRVATIAFVHPKKSSREIAQSANAQRLGIRFGHFYAYRLCESLGIKPDDGVVRTSLVHYNTMEEVEALIRFFEKTI